MPLTEMTTPGQGGSDGGAEIIMDSGISGINTSTYTYISTPKKAKYVCFIVHFGNNSTCVTEWKDGVQYMSFLYNGTYYDRDTSSATVIDVQDDKVGFKYGNNQWSNPMYTICM